MPTTAASRTREHAPISSLATDGTAALWDRATADQSTYDPRLDMTPPTGRLTVTDRRGLPPRDDEFCVGPVLWVVENGPARVFLFGDTSGVEGDAWLTERIRESLISSSTFWRELPEPAEMAASPRLPSASMSSVPLRARLDSRVNDKFEAACEELAIDVEGLQPFRPWVAVQMVEQAHLMRAGMRTSSDVAPALTAMAVEHDLQLRFEYDVDDALDLFAGMHNDVESDYVDWTLSRMRRSAEDADREVGAWLAGDVSVATELDADVSERFSAMYEHLLIARNRAWVPRIESMLDRPESTFVLAGFGHLVGEHGVPALLRATRLAVSEVD